MIFSRHGEVGLNRNGIIEIHIRRFSHRRRRRRDSKNWESRALHRLLRAEIRLSSRKKRRWKKR